MQLRYILIVPNNIQEIEVTAFQGWNPVVRNPDFLSLIYLLTSLPAAAEEIFLTQNELISLRRSGQQRNVVCIGASLLAQINISRTDEMVVLLALAEDIPLIKECKLLAKENVILLSPSDDPAAIDIRNIESPPHELIDKEILRLLPKNAVGIHRIRDRYNIKVSFPKNHGINIPNMAVLRSLGFEIEEKTREINSSFEEAEQLVVDSANIVRRAIAREEFPNPETLLYAPSVKPHFYEFKNVAWNNILRYMPEKWKRKMLEATFRNPGYSDFQIKLSEELSNPYNDRTLGPILAERQSELYATTASIALMASNETSVSIRLPNSINLQGARLRNLETLAKRSDANAPRLLQREFRNFNSQMKLNIGEKIIDLIRNGGRACKICSDVPVEWLYIDDLPLMISHEVSRIPMTPGNSQLQYAGTGERVAFKDIYCRKILVVRSFSDKDPLLNVFSHCLDQLRLKERLNITIIDVSTGTEAKKALNEFDGNIVVFDCHGDHGGNSSFGWLQFGKEKINTWELAYQARIPPIVLLSACSTTAIGGSHMSVSSGLLRSGAHSVLGTFLPVDGPRSALFMARILARIDTFLPAIKNAGFKIITWRAFVHSVLQMSFLTDVLVYFKFELGIIGDETLLKVELKALPSISLGDPNWYVEALETISEASNIPREELARKITEDHPLMETMRYCQVGMPDRIGIFFADED